MRIHPRGGILAVLAVVAASLGVVSGVSAAGSTLRIEVDGQPAAEGTPFTVRVVGNADVPTSGVQASVTFDQTRVQITSVTRGAPWADAPIFVGADAANIATANTTGKLATVAVAFFPPGSVAAGNTDFLVISFEAIACGQSNLDLPIGPLDGAMLDGRADTYGDKLPVTTTGGSVTACPTSTPALTGVGSTSQESDGGPLPWLPLGLAALAVAAGGLALLRRSMRTSSIDTPRHGGAGRAP